jgi:hypothetical protein
MRECLEHTMVNGAISEAVIMKHLHISRDADTRYFTIFKTALHNYHSTMSVALVKDVVAQQDTAIPRDSVSEPALKVG